MWNKHPNSQFFCDQGSQPSDFQHRALTILGIVHKRQNKRQIHMANAINHKNSHALATSLQDAHNVFRLDQRHLIYISCKAQLLHSSPDGPERPALSD